MNARRQGAPILPGGPTIRPCLRESAFLVGGRPKDLKMRLGGRKDARSGVALVAIALVVASAGAIPAAALGGANAAGSHPPGSHLAGGGHAAGSNTVLLAHKRFLPGTVSIRRGESVTWLWRDGGVLHNVIGHGFQSRAVTHGSFTVRFTRDGTYRYTCTLHPHMDGSITVR